MYGGDVYNQNASAAGVTYNCGGEIPTPLPRVRPPPYARVSRISRLTLSHPSLLSREQIAGRRSCFVPGTSSSAASAATASCTRNARNRVRPRDPRLFQFSFRAPVARQKASVSGATASQTYLTVPSPVPPPQSSNSRRDERRHESRRCAGLRRKHSRRGCKRTNEAFARSKILSNVQQMFRLIYEAEGRFALDPFLPPF